MQFELKQTVTIHVSGEWGQVVGRVEYTDDGNHYLVRYKSAQGIAKEEWWKESALRAGATTMHQ